MSRESIVKLINLYDSGHDVYRLAAIFKIRHEKVVSILKANNRSGVAYPDHPSVSRKKSNMRKVIEAHQKITQNF